MEESGHNPTWEAASALVCVFALVIIVAIVQMWPAPAAANDLQLGNNAETLSRAWSKAPALRHLTKSSFFQNASDEHQDLLVWG